MKKYLMTGIAALAMCAAFTSCSHDVEPMSQEDLNNLEAQKIVADYETAFIKAFGQPAASQDWGFGTETRAAFTRTADPGNGGAYFGPEQGATYKAMGIVAPEMVSADEEEFVSNWFKNNKNPKSDEIDLSTFFVQQVYFGTKEYTGYDGNNAPHKVVGGQHMDWLCAGSEEIGDDHINNFNTSAPERYYVEGGWTNAREYQSKIMLMVNSSTKRFGFKESQGEGGTVFHNFVLKKLTFNGKVGYYVGFDYENHGQNGDFPKDGFYDDRIIKIVPGDGIIPSEYEGRIIAEDLSANEASDFDFNDVVFDYKYVDGGVKILLLAAGGTLPLRLNGDDVNYEVHKLFEVDTKVMVNTGIVSKDPVEFTITGSFDNTKNGDDIKIEVNKGTTENPNWIELTAVKGRVASKVRVYTDYDWCSEREDIDDKYCATHDHFTEYVGGQWAWNTWYKQD